MTSSLLLNLRAIRGRSYPRIIGLLREPSWLFYDTVLPILSVAAYAYIYKALDVQNVHPEFVGFVIIGGVMTAYWLNVLWSMAAQFYWEKEVGNLQLYLVAPMSRMAVLLGMALGGMFMSSTRAIATLVIGTVLFRVSFVPDAPLLLIAVFLVTLVALYGMGMMFASLFLLYGREAWHTTNLLQEPVYLVSGFYFPVRQLGMPVAIAASVLPITLGLDAMRQLLFPEALPYWLLPAELELVILCGLAVVFIILSRYSLAYLENLAKREGRLTLRWQ